MARPRRRRLVAGALSLLVPGAGQLYAGARRRGLVLLGLALAATLAFALAAPHAELGRGGLAALLALDVVLLAIRLFSVLDAVGLRIARVALVALVALVAAPHVLAGYLGVRGYGVLEHVFASEEPTDVLPGHGLFVGVSPGQEQQRWPELSQPPSAPTPEPARLPAADAPIGGSRQVLAAARPVEGGKWTTLLLLGTDEGPGNFGARTDTMILAAIQHGTGRAVAFGIPRNLVGVPLGGEAATAIPKFGQPLNALLGFAREQPELFAGGADPGTTALKQAVSTLLGIRVDYFALVNLLGFADLVDGLGGVTIRVKERLLDSVTRPAWGEPKPRIDVRPGEVHHFYGREALAYVRSRKASSDYTRMARQRCFLSAMAAQIDPVRVLRNFPSLARTVERNVSTDVPLKRLPSLIRLVAGIDPDLTLTETFGADYIKGRRKADNYPIPRIERMRTTVRAAILNPQYAQAGRGIVSAGKSC